MAKTTRIQLNNLAENEQELNRNEMANVKGGNKTVVNEKGDTWVPKPLPTDTTGGPVVLPPTVDPAFKPIQK